MNRSTPLTSPFRILPLARMAKGGRWRTEAMRSYGAPVLYWFTRGQGRITVAGQTSGYGSHNAVFLPAGTMHGFEMSSQVHGMIVVFPAGVEKQLDLPEAPLHLRLREADQHAELNRLVENLQTEMQSSATESDAALMCHAGLLAIWLRRQIDIAEVDTERAPKTAAMRLAAAYTSLVETEFHSSKSVRDYAAELGVTPTHLSRVCNKACGRPASAILADRVHYEARRMLTETHMPIKDIASALGFASPAYLHAHSKTIPALPLLISGAVVKRTKPSFYFACNGYRLGIPVRNTLRPMYGFPTSLSVFVAYAMMSFYIGLGLKGANNES